ncbi:MAG: TetR/AcrR family transcriptional regulator [Bacteroidota bacterium]
MTPDTALLNAAAVVLARNPGAPLADIAAEAGIGRATLHRRYATRTDLLRALALESLEQTEQVLAPLLTGDTRGADRLAAVADALVPLGARFHFLMSEIAIYDDPEVSGAYEAHLTRLGSLIESLKADDALAPDVPTAWGVIALDALVWGAWSAVEEGYLARRDAPVLVTRTLLTGLSPSP